jgi:hypothetical protein
MVTVIEKAKRAQEGPMVIALELYFFVVHLACEGIVWRQLGAGYRVEHHVVDRNIVYLGLHLSGIERANNFLLLLVVCRDASRAESMSTPQHQRP